VCVRVQHERGAQQDTDLTAEDLKVLVGRYKGVYRSQGKVFPEDPYEQLRSAIYAVFDSWQSERAKVYRAVGGITGLKGTAVNVQVPAPARCVVGPGVLAGVLRCSQPVPCRLRGRGCRQQQRHSSRASLD
jgi:phosphoenolpyruvate synthase/pyruvate phosphate dikinase